MQLPYISTNLCPWIRHNKLDILTIKFLFILSPPFLDINRAEKKGAIPDGTEKLCSAIFFLLLFFHRPFFLFLLFGIKKTIRYGIHIKTDLMVLTVCKFGYHFSVFPIIIITYIFYFVKSF